ncbi:MAG: hypothetical protein H0V81_16210 [Solirubrobacterales bacterium]|nr:hypothetical protein [Solirubrobacterales bacterium]
MSRLVVLWTRPHHLSATEADAWVRGQLDRLRAVEGLQHARLSPLRTASLNDPREWDWMLELHPAEGTSAIACTDSQVWREWLGDLRLLGMRPTVLLADTPSVVEGQDPA